MRAAENADQRRRIPLLGTSVNMVDKMPDLKRYEAARIVATPDGSQPHYYRIFEGYFEDFHYLRLLDHVFDGLVDDACEGGHEEAAVGDDVIEAPSR